MKNYTIYHLHTMLSNGVTNIDSVTKYSDYVNKAKECGMTSLAFSEHGNVFEWKHKKDAVEKAGMKYIHAIETYITEKLFWEDENGESIKTRDNYHCVLIAKNYEGLKEINRLSSRAFNREDGHFYYTPRITFEELINTSDNIIVTTACIANILCKSKEDSEIKKKYIEFLKNNSNRCFLEVQHHNTDAQKEYNRYLYDLSKKTGIRLIAGTDTHCLNEQHAETRVVLQRGKNTFFEGEEGWDLTFKTYEELVDAYRIQNVLPEDIFLEAIENTNVMADMIEPFELDTSFKYPKISKNPNEKLKEIIFDENKINDIVSEGYDRKVVTDRITEEYETAKAVDSCEYFLLQKYITDWCHENDVWTGPGRGSAAASLILYIFGTTEINPLKHGFQFWRFMHKDKYSLADIDLDYSNEDREKVLRFMLKDHLNLENIRTSHIITFNTIALRGAIKDIGRGLGMSIEETSMISNAVHEESEDENKITTIDDEWRERYPELFKHVDIAIGTIVSIGSHPSGVLVADRNIEEEIGTCYLKDNEYPVSCLNMKELDSLNFVKFDVLGLDNVDIINETCKLAGIPRISAKSVDIEDDNVWKSIQENTDLLFQISGQFGSRTISKIFSEDSMDRIKNTIQNFSRMDLFAFTNALLRPCGKSVYEDATNGIARVTGIKEVDDLLGSELGYPLFQETQMEFVMSFCGYTFLESDHLRKCISKGSYVTMADGTLKPIEDVRAGDRVISYDGEIFSGQNVLNTWNNGKRKTIKITLEDGISLSCTEDHRVLTQDGWKEAKYLSKTDCVYSPRKIICDDDGLKSNRKLSNLQYWFLGALIGDGTLGQKYSLSFTNSDKKIIDKCVCALSEFVKNAEYNISETEGITVDKVYCLRILGDTKKTIFNILDKYDLRCQSNDKNISEKIARLNPTEKLENFVAGLFNTDGGYNIGRKSIEYYTKSKKLVEQIRTLLLKFGIYSKVSPKFVSGYDYTSYTLDILGADNIQKFNKYFMAHIVGNKFNELKNIIDMYSGELRRYVPIKCRDEIFNWCKKQNISVRQFYQSCNLPEIKFSNKYNLTADQAKIMIQNCYAPYTYKVLNGDFVCVPVKSIEDDGYKEVYDIEVENTHNFVVNNIVAHNCVAKKIGTRELLPVIRDRFYENGAKNLNLSSKQSENIIEPFLQCILDATRYSFCRIHAYSYSYIGYMCAYLRYYYPIEYLTACLNVWKDKEDKTNESVEYARKIGIKILEPKFRYGRSEYSFDKENNCIYKGMKSVKYLNDDCSNYLYSLKDNDYDNFSALLYDIYESKSVNARQLNVLIKLGFFDKFGNSKELLRITNMFDFFKEGKAKTLNKSKVSKDSVVYSIIQRNSKESEKTFTKLNTPKILTECEELIRGWRIPDFSIKEKALTQKEYLGYINIETDKKEDRPKILVIEKRTMCKRGATSPWGVVIEGQSLGSGKKTRYTIFYKTYTKEPFDELDLIYIDEWKKEGEYFYIKKYHKIY